MNSKLQRFNSLAYSRVGLIFILVMALALLLLYRLENPFPGVIVYVCGLLYAAWQFFHSKGKALTSVLLAISLSWNWSAQAQEAPSKEEPVFSPAGLPALCLFALIAGTVGTIAGCRLNDFCKKHYAPPPPPPPPPTNTPPGELRLYAQGEGGDGWALSGPSTINSCYCPPETDFVPLFDGDPGPQEDKRPFLELTVVTEEVEGQIQAKLTNPAFIASVNKAELDRLNLRLFGKTLNDPHAVNAARNGRAVSPETLPVTWWNKTLMLTNGAFAGQYSYAKVSLEVSLEIGSPSLALLTYVAPVGFSMPISVPHPIGVQGFYRARVEPFEMALVE